MPENDAQPTETVEPKFKPIPRYDSEPEGKKPPLMVVGDTFVAQSAEGEFRIPLSIPRKVHRGMAEEGESASAQFDYLLRARGEQEILERFDDVDDVEAAIIVRGFFEAYALREVRRLGEFMSSSPS